MLRAAGRTRRTPDDLGSHGGAQGLGEPLPRGYSVAQLRAMLFGADREHCPGDPSRQLVQHSCALDIIQGRRGAEIETQLHPRVRGVDALSAGTGRMAELLDELSRPYGDAVRRTGSRGNTQVVHPTSLSQCALR